ncbi:MAG TPA: Do family serine endopeptidase [Caulobacteraceae bacterium]|jgi:Do/DeqQ family serine protease|nr:Do family serine endopeptidase [Caulobacteraceae bacterium]
MPRRLLIALLCLAGLAAPAHAQSVPTDAAQMRLSFAPIVKKAGPAVVNVYSRRVVRQQVDPFFQMFGGGMGLSRERIAQSLGSGVIVRPDGVIVTNNHVIEGGQDIMVVLGDRREFPAKVLLADPHADVAVLKIDAGAERLPVLPLAAGDQAQVGDLVLAIGDPFGLGQTVTNGIVSALARSNVGVTDVSYFIQTDAAINPGNSGGALVDMNGQMIGMNTAILSQSGTSSGVGFAIPAALVRHVVDEAIGGGVQARTWLGLKTQGVTAEIARSMGLDRPDGVLITDVWPGGPADEAGLKPGDLILTLDGEPVNDEASLNYHVLTRNSGDAVTVQYRRGKGEPQSARLRMAPIPASPARDERTLTGRNPLGGATVANLSPAVADEMGLDPFAAGHGVLITKVEAGYAASVGLRPGDLIVQVNGHSPTSVAGLQALLDAPAGSGWTLVIQRGGQTITAQFRL